MNKLSYFAFILGLLILPLESTPLKISAGWNAVGHLPFVISFLLLLFSLNFKYQIFFVKLLFAGSLARILILLLPCFSFISYVLIGFPNFSSFAEEAFKLTLTLNFSFLLFFYFRIKRKSLKVLLNSLTLSYGLSLGIGILAWGGIRLPFFSYQRGGILESGLGKIAFTFSEPSFVSPHLLGVLLLIIIISYRLGYGNTNSWRRCLALLIVFIIFSLITGSSFRVLIDGLLIATFLVLYAFNKTIASLGRLLKKTRVKFYTLIIFLLVVLLVFIYMFFKGNLELFQLLSSNNINRIDGVLNGLSDPSTALRSMRIAVTLNSWYANILTFLIGGGFANMCNMTIGLPGFGNYFEQLQGMPEYISIYGVNCIDVSYSMHLTLIASFGIIGYSLIIAVFGSKNLFIEMIILAVVLIQTDSLAFYGISIYLWRYASCRFDSTASFYGLHAAETLRRTNSLKQ